VKVDETVDIIANALLSGVHDLSLVVEVLPPAIHSTDRYKIALDNLLVTDSIPYAGSVSEKIHNIELATSRLDGVLIPPGDVFSFNETLGPTGVADGYQIGWAITTDGTIPVTVQGEGGGICQVVTTLFHTVYWAGLPVVERWPHLYWIHRYGQPPLGMKGLDATVYSPWVDFKFHNNTQNWLAIRSRTDGEQVFFELYGPDPNWYVESHGPFITDVVEADDTIIRQE
jgi:vancomycin resistance protein YoaR